MSVSGLGDCKVGHRKTIHLVYRLQLHEASWLQFTDDIASAKGVCCDGSLNCIPDCQLHRVGDVHAVCENEQRAAQQFKLNRFISDPASAQRADLRQVTVGGFLLPETRFRYCTQSILIQ